MIFFPYLKFPMILYLKYSALIKQIPWAERRRHWNVAYLYGILEYEKPTLPNKCQNIPQILIVSHLDTMLLPQKFIKIAFNPLKVNGSIVTF
jgi:hypothetical protein